jgi:trehalose 6-phosphate phosphatase
VRSRPAAIAALAKRPSASGLVLDFDGVLSPIVQDPDASELPRHVAETLGRLAEHLGLLAVMSGRPARFLAGRIQVPGVPLLGSYGIEQISDGVSQLDQDAEPWLAPVREAYRELTERMAGSPGVRVEEKPISVAVHWRQAPDQSAAGAEVKRVTGEIAGRTGLRAEPGKLVWELRPPIDVDKGTAITRLLAGRDLDVVAYAGDDLGDLPALRAVKATNGYALVVDHGPETDQRLLDIADQTFAGTGTFAGWLAELAGALGD